jgi:hypothetical protein
VVGAPNHQTSRLVEAAVAWRTGQSSAPPNTVRCASHVTRPLGSDRRSFCLLGHRTGPVDYLVRRLARALTSARAAAHCSAFNVLYTRPLARSSRCSAGTPDSPVNYSGAAPRFPEGGKFGVGFLVHRTLSGGTPDSPVRQTRAHFGCLLLSWFEPFLGLFIGLL